MKFIIRKGKHRARPWIFRLWWNKMWLGYRVMFDYSCSRLPQSDDAMDVNKLFGIGYFPSHHKDSIRFGWNYNPKNELINIYAYWYENGQRNFRFICEVLRGRYYDYQIRVSDASYELVVEVPKTSKRWSVTLPKSHNKKLSHHLGIYFGGNQPAPERMLIEMKRL